MTHLWGTVGISGVYCSTVQILANLIWIDHFCPMICAVSHKCTRYLRSFELSISDELKCQIYKKKEMFHVHLKNIHIGLLNRSAYNITHTVGCFNVFYTHDL